ncbi:hypothetical protein P6709_09700 [Jeotgalibacillus sp. ET6]|uniref:hypothetical protein n=1 Tax=Jeotgalibacillus sp. ET6 TaxID=3037260 RepID=UPI002418473A|nr:hypothetical protein [Jeotgalibacillus sp. ET6]MDG5472024.1 hypothetical protein [Jeotgalibacillus sp. ET6]
MTHFDELFLFQRDLNRLKELKSTIPSDNCKRIVLDDQIYLLDRALHLIQH